MDFLQEVFQGVHRLDFQVEEARLVDRVSHYTALVWARLVC